jgi:hypothetical protein
MINDRERIESAKWLFERTLGWIATADVKVGVAIALDTAMLGGLAAAFAGSDYHIRTGWCYFFVAAATAGMGFAMFCAGMAALPRMQGPVKSMIFFGRVAEIDADTYVDEFSKMTEMDLLADLAMQIHRNSEIARDKHHWVRKSLFWSFLSTGAWLIAIAMLVKV